MASKKCNPIFNMDNHLPIKRLYMFIVSDCCGRCFACNARLAELFDVSERHIKRLLQTLENYNLIVRVGISKNRVIYSKAAWKAKTMNKF